MQQAAQAAQAAKMGIRTPATKELNPPMWLPYLYSVPRGHTIVSSSIQATVERLDNLIRVVEREEESDEHYDLIVPDWKDIGTSISMLAQQAVVMPAKANLAAGFARCASITAFEPKNTRATIDIMKLSSFNVNSESIVGILAGLKEGVVEMRRAFTSDPTAPILWIGYHPPVTSAEGAQSFKGLNFPVCGTQSAWISQMEGMQRGKLAASNKLPQKGAPAPQKGAPAPQQGVVTRPPRASSAPPARDRRPISDLTVGMNTLSARRNALKRPDAMLVEVSKDINAVMDEITKDVDPSVGADPSQRNMARSYILEALACTGVSIKNSGGALYPFIKRWVAAMTVGRVNELNRDFARFVQQCGQYLDSAADVAKLDTAYIALSAAMEGLRAEVDHDNLSNVRKALGLAE